MTVDGNGSPTGDRLMKLGKMRTYPRMFQLKSRKIKDYVKEGMGSWGHLKKFLTSTVIEPVST
jgi:hypothetical protein